MIVLDAKGPTPDVVDGTNEIVVVFRAIHPVSGEACDSAIIQLSVHNAFFLSEQLRRVSIAAIDRSRDQLIFSSIMPLQRSADADEV